MDGWIDRQKGKQSETEIDGFKIDRWIEIDRQVD